jgi:hypothetical protein
MWDAMTRRLSAREPAGNAGWSFRSRKTPMEAREERRPPFADATPKGALR